ncbi:helix-turn-helix domain-containing protein [Streptomyces sp. NPDC090131]|uniref:helix-turn-helix domain-containing protein n=1 Tax=Streptomyces sp. NPDC090131 TaxID=3365954 RepID=UPI003801FC7A
MAPPVRVRRLTEQEGQKLQQIVRRGSTSSVRFRRAMMLLASAGGSTVPVIARLVQADEDTVRDVIHKFNEIGLACLHPQWAGGRPRLLSPDDEDFVIQTATTRPTQVGKPFTRWSISKLADHLRRDIARPVRIGREALRCLLARRGITFQRTQTWKESPDPDWRMRKWAARNKVELCFTPTYASWANPIEAHFGPLRQFTLANSHHPNHTAQTRALHAYLRWRNKNARHPEVLAAQRRERARIRSEKGIRWGGRPLRTAA